MDTLLLTQDIWDLCIDANGNIALASAPYAIAQDVASAIRTFLGEVWYNTTIGINYFASILGHTPSLAVFQQAMVNAALTVPNVVSATCVLNSFQNRNVTGTVTVTDDTGTTQTIAI